MPIKVRDLIRMVESDGWRLARTVGSHRHYKHPVKSGLVTIPGHPSAVLPLGTEKGILEQAGLRKRQ